MKHRFKVKAAVGEVRFQPFARQLHPGEHFQTHHGLSGCRNRGAAAAARLLHPVAGRTASGFLAWSLATAHFSALPHNKRVESDALQRASAPCLAIVTPQKPAVMRRSPAR